MAKKQAEPTVRATSATIGRQTQASNALGAFGWTIVPRRQSQAIDVSRLDMRRLSAQQMLSYLADMSPEVSLALWNELRLTVGPRKLVAKRLNADEPDPTAQKALDELAEIVGDDSGGLDSLLTQWTLTLFLQGACAAELIPTEDLRDAADAIAVQPFIVQFRYDEQSRVSPWAPNLLGEIVALNQDLFWYVALDNEPDDPYGRAPAAPVIGEIMFSLQLFADLKAAIHTNAWGRLDVSVVRELVQAAALKVYPGDPIKAATWIEGQLAEIQSVYNSLNPDDTFIHWDWVTVKSVDASGKVLQIAPLIRVLELRTIRALKQLPILMGSNEGTTETHGTVQFEIFVAGIEALRSKISWLASRVLETALQLRGLQARVSIEWESIRTTDRKTDAEAEGLEIANAIAKRDQGWIDQETASLEITGSEAVGEPVQPPAPVVVAAPTDQPTMRPANVRRAKRPAQPENRAAEADLIDEGTGVVARAFVDLADDFPTDSIAAQLDDDQQNGRFPFLTDPHGEVRVNYSAKARRLVEEWFRGDGQLWAEDFAGSLESYHAQTWDYGGKRALSELGLDGEFSLQDSALLDRINQHASEQVAKINQTSVDRLTDAAARALASGGKKADIAKALEAEFADFAGERSKLIASAEFRDQLGAVSHEVYSRNGVGRRSWVTMGDTRVEIVCLENEDASPVAIDQPFPSGHMFPGSHPRCRCSVKADTSAWQAPETPWTGG